MNIPIPPIPNPKDFRLNSLGGNFQLSVSYAPLRRKGGKPDIPRYFLALSYDEKIAEAPIIVSYGSFQTEEKAWEQAERGWEGWVRNDHDSGLLKELADAKR